MNTLAAFAPTWLEGIVTPEIYERYGQKVEHSKKARTAAEKEAKAITIGIGIYAGLEGVPLAQTRVSHFEKMAHQKLAIA